MYYSTPKKLIIVGGADFSDDLFKEVYDNELPIIAADGGANFLAENNIYPELVMGDLDSVSEQNVQNIEPKRLLGYLIKIVLILKKFYSTRNRP